MISWTCVIGRAYSSPARAKMTIWSAVSCDTGNAPVVECLRFVAPVLGELEAADEQRQLLGGARQLLRGRGDLLGGGAGLLGGGGDLLAGGAGLLGHRGN